MFGQEIEQGSMLVREIPTQYGGATEAKVLGSIEGAVETVDTGDFATNVILNASIAGSLQFLWSIVKSQQIIILFALFAITMPANAKSVFSVLL